MIYLQNTTDPQVVFVPKPGAVPEGNLVFQAKSTIDLDFKIAQVVTDLRTSDLYFNLAIALPAGLPDGEYEYYLGVGAQLLATGLLLIGEAPESSEYQKEITYEQYESE